MTPNFVVDLLSQEPGDYTYVCNRKMSMETCLDLNAMSFDFTLISSRIQLALRCETFRGPFPSYARYALRKL